MKHTWLNGFSAQLRWAAEVSMRIKVHTVLRN